ncbi:MAG: type II secretion system protein M [Zoogloeaceae bacterium]|jgi:hypothetical protein|nr:type II secretion system protein M [Zoogloeaceae bacterium]
MRRIAAAMSGVRRKLALRWAKFSPAERHQIAGAASFMIALCYALLIWAPGDKRLGELVYKEQKQSIRSRSANKAEEELKKNNMAGLNPQAIQLDLARARASLERQEAELERLLARFVPLEDLESLQMLKAELTRLAENGDMEVIALEHIYRRPEERDRPPTLELLKESMTANPYKRPLLRLKARASYWGLIAFLDGLSGLSHVAAPVWSDVSVKSDAAPNSTRQWLEMEIRLAI